MQFTVRLKGGQGSGHFGHSGRLGKVGGSIPGTGVTIAAVDDALSESYANIERNTWDVNDAAWVSPSGRIFSVNYHAEAAGEALEMVGSTVSTDSSIMVTMRKLGYARVIINKVESDFDVQIPMKRGTRAALAEILELQNIKNLVWIVHGYDNELVAAGSGIPSFNRVVDR